MSKLDTGLTHEGTASLAIDAVRKLTSAYETTLLFFVIFWYSAIIQSATESEHSFRLKQVLENVFATSSPSVQEISHEKRIDI